MTLCKFCSRSFSSKRSTTFHEKYCTQNPSAAIRNSWNKGLTKETDSRVGKNTSWNKGLTKETDSRVGNYANSMRESLLVTGKSKSDGTERERCRKISDKMKIVGGGLRHGSGRGKKGWFKGFFCDSSYELAYVIYCIDHNKSISRNTEKRTYIWENKERTYVPDFVVDDCIVEIKGYKSEQWLAKLKHNPDIMVLYFNDMDFIFDYVISKYGKNFISLYEMGKSGEEL